MDGCELSLQTNQEPAALFALALVLVAITGCIVQSAPAQSTGNTINMGATTFNRVTLTIKKGERITFVGDRATGTLHILVVGAQGQAKTEAGAADFKGRTGITFQPGDSWTSPTWNTPGTYHVTCTVHPTTMNLTITVTA